MADIFDRETRSLIMSKIKGKDTKPEITVRKFLFSKGFRYRKNQKSLPGKPDIVLKKHSAVVMVNGCFWHGHKGCPKFKIPKSNVDFWREKITKNIKRDKVNQKRLSEMGWRIFNVWECETNEKRLSEVAIKIKKNKES